METPNRSTTSLLISLTLVIWALVLVFLAVVLVLGALFPFIVSGHIDPNGMILGAAFVTEALILCWAAYMCFQKYLRREASESQTQFRMPTPWILLLILGTGVPLAVGYFVHDLESLNWIVLPIVTVPAVLLPIFLLLGLGINRISLGHRWRVWGVFGLGMTLGPLALFLVELIILVLSFIVLVVVIALNPEWNSELQNLAYQIQQVQEEPEAILKVMMPYVLKPGVILAALLFFAGIAPLVEELIKPIGVWFLAGRLESPAQGFALGALSGGAFALIETFGSIAQSADWPSLVATRIATGLLHITCTALVGWGIALAWRERNLLRLLLAYLGSTFLHGAWNGTVILYSFSALAREGDPANPLGKLAPITLGIAILLIIVLLTILITSNRKLRQPEPPEVPVLPESIPA